MESAHIALDASLKSIEYCFRLRRIDHKDIVSPEIAPSFLQHSFPLALNPASLMTKCLGASDFSRTLVWDLKVRGW